MLRYGYSYSSVILFHSPVWEHLLYAHVIDEETEAYSTSCQSLLHVPFERYWWHSYPVVQLFCHQKFLTVLPQGPTRKGRGFGKFKGNSQSSVLERSHSAAKQRMINKGWCRLGWYSEAGSAQPSVYTDNLSRKSSGQRGRNTGSHSGSAIICFVALSRSLNFPGLSFLICQMPKSLQHQRLGISEGREHYCWRVYVCAHTCALRIRTDLILQADSCMRGSMLSVMFYKMAGRVLLFFFSLFQFIQNSSLSSIGRQMLGWGIETSTCWAENRVRGREIQWRIQEVIILVEEQSCLMEGLKGTGSFFPVWREAT